MLQHEECSACRPDAPRVSEEEGRELLLQLPDWAIVTVQQVPQLKREYKTRNFVEAQGLAVQIGEMAESLQHHPEITYGWGYLRLVWYTHKINGLHRNDFICAAKSDEIVAQQGT